MKEKYIEAHMKVAEIYADLSSAKRMKVGCVVVKDNTIIGIGYNGMPSGWDNTCENFVGYGSNGEERLNTKPEVLHAETNAIAKISKSTHSSEGATLFVTHAPCLECAKLIYQSGINSVYYRDTYRNDEGLKFLEQCKIETLKINKENK